jgi:hypothetical protein
MYAMGLRSRGAPLILEGWPDPAFFDEHNMDDFYNEKLAF